MGGIVKGVKNVVGKVVDVGKDLAGPALSIYGAATGNPGLVAAGQGISGIFGAQDAAKQAEKGAKQAAQAADPFGAYRSQFGNQLLALYADPSQTAQLPGYQFLEGQGQAGANARLYGDQLNALMTDPSSITSRPGYQFRLNEGLSAIDRNASRAGYLGSGNRLLELTRYGQDYASSEYDNEVNRLSQLMQDSRDFESMRYDNEMNRLMGLAGASDANYGASAEALLAAGKIKGHGTLDTLGAIGETVGGLWKNRGGSGGGGSDFGDLSGSYDWWNSRVV
jgi:hypothetical protein